MREFVLRLAFIIAQWRGCGGEANSPYQIKLCRITYKHGLS